MIREDTNKNIIERFPSMESDLKLHAIPQLNKNKEDIWTAIKILAFYAVLGVYAYYKYMEMTGECVCCSHVELACYSYRCR